MFYFKFRSVDFYDSYLHVKNAFSSVLNEWRDALISSI